MSRQRATTIIVVAVAYLATGDARSEGPGKSRGAARAPTAEEFAALKQRVDEQHELLMMLSFEVRQLLQSTGRAGPGVAPPPAPRGGDVVGGGGGSGGTGGPVSVVLPVSKLATITGRVEVKGKPWGPIYVYVENVKESPVDRSVEILQKDRSFIPNVLVVQKGTRVAFPNGDPFLHNVFSPSATQPFDLGSYRQGDAAGAVRLFQPGVVEVLCNMHAKMRANVLVVPNHYHVKASGDGSFRLENVPVGSRQLVAWTPDARPVTEAVTLTGAGANVKFALQVGPPPPRIDKDGKPRSGYRQEE
jgi:plastocyanin